MRLFASLGAILLALGACSHIPEDVRVVVDGRTIVLKKAGENEPPPAPAPAPEEPIPPGNAARR